MPNDNNYPLPESSWPAQDVCFDASAGPGDGNGAAISGTPILSNTVSKFSENPDTTANLDLDYAYIAGAAGWQGVSLSAGYNGLVAATRQRMAQALIAPALVSTDTTKIGAKGDDNLASLTERIGAEAIITGSLDDTGSEYRFRIRVIGTETTAAVMSYAATVNKNDRRIVAFSNLRPKTTGEKIGTGVLNTLLGLGSYLDGDIAGGLTLTAGYATATGLFVIEATMLDWDSPAVGVPATIGAAIAGVTLVYGFVRPFIFSRSPQMIAVLDNMRLKIVPTMGEYTGRNNIGIQLSYSLKL
jgi:hypothetical protein